MLGVRGSAIFEEIEAEAAPLVLQRIEEAIGLGTGDRVILACKRGR